MRNSVDTILFDLDGCIVDTLPMWLKSFQQTFKKFHISITDAELLKIGFHRIYDHKLHIQSREEFINEVYGFYTKNFLDSPLHQNALSTLKKLKRNNFKTALVTSSRRSVVDIFLEKQRVSQYFDYTLAWEDTKANKPDPEPLLKAIQLLKSDPERSIMIGDSDTDISAARAAHVTSIWYHPPQNTVFYNEDTFTVHNPDFTIHDFEELFPIINL